MGDEKKQNSFTITLVDGTQLTGLELNGNNFISKTRLSESTFAGKLGHVVISGNGEFDDFGLIGEHENMQLVQSQQYGEEYWFILRDLTPQELKDIRTEARLDYIEMMEDL